MWVFGKSRQMIEDTIERRNYRSDFIFYTAYLFSIHRYGQMRNSTMEKILDSSVIRLLIVKESNVMQGNSQV